MNLVLGVVLLLCCAALSRGDGSSANVQKVRAGLDAATAILNVMEDTESSRTFGNIGRIAAKVGPFLGAIGPIFSLIGLFQPSPEIQFMKREFAEMDANFDRLFNRFGEVQNLIRETGLRSQYSTYEHSILSLSEKLQAFLAAQSWERDVHNRSFVRQYTSGYNGATDKLWRGMTRSRFVVSDNIPLAAMDYTDNNRKRTQNIMKGMLNLILQGVKVELGYLSAKNLTNDYNVQKRIWDDRIKQLVNHMKDMDRVVKNRWHDQLESDVPAKLAEWEGWGNSYFGSQLYNFLTTKYDWRDWHVVAYNELRGDTDHWVKWCGGIHRFRTHGRNLVVASVDQSKSPINTWHARSMLSGTSTSRCTRGFWMVLGSCRDRRARDIYEHHLDSELRNGCTYAAVGIIRKNAHIAHEGPSNRLTYLDNGRYKLHAFG